MNKEEWFEKATAYFNDAMTAEEIKLFETETAASEELSQLMQLWKTTDAEAAIYERYKEQAAAFIATHKKLQHDFVDEQTVYKFSTTENETIKNVRKIKFSVWQLIAVAALIIGIILGIELFISSPKKEASVARKNTPRSNVDTASNNSRNIPANKNTANATDTPKQNQAAILYAQAFTPDKIPENPNGALDDAFFYYASGQYKNAVAAIDGARAKTATRGNNTFSPLTDFYATYYKALSQMSLGNTAAAIPLLQQALQQSPADILSIKAQWYLSLAYLKEEKISAAAETLQLLKNDPAAGAYKSKAEKILTAIRNE
jgi:tetratricopeptide (TPR) repeat protein